MLTSPGAHGGGGRVVVVVVEPGLGLGGGLDGGGDPEEPDDPDDPDDPEDVVATVEPDEPDDVAAEDDDSVRAGSTDELVLAEVARSFGEGWPLGP